MGDGKGLHWTARSFRFATFQRAANGTGKRFRGAVKERSSWATMGVHRKG